MSAPENLEDVYLDELKDLWSANDQMSKVMKKLVGKAGGKQLKSMLEQSIAGIGKHTDVLKGLIAAHDSDVKKEHCKGMEGLVAEATKHAIDETIEDADVRDVIIIAQYQRMSHYGIAGFGTAAAYATALGFKDDVMKLDAATKEIYQGDVYMTSLAEKSVNLHAKD